MPTKEKFLVFNNASIKGNKSNTYLNAYQDSKYIIIIDIMVKPIVSAICSKID